MGIFSSKKEKSELTLVFDIGSSSVGGAIFLTEKSGVPKIIYSVRESIPLENKIDFDRFLSSTVLSLETVASQICLKGLGAPKKIFCILSSPWYASQIRVIHLEKNTSFTFNSKLADNLIQNEIKLFEEEVLLKNKHAHNKLRPIEFKNMKTLLNGYAVSNPLNQKTKELEMNIFISMSPEQVLLKMEEAIGRHFNSKNIKFCSFGMASFAMARDMFSHQDDFILVDIGGEVTDMSMVKKDILFTSSSFPHGRNFIIRGVAATLDISLGEAKSFISLYKDGHASDSVKKKLDSVVNKLKAEWLKNFQECLADISKGSSIPVSILVTADKDLADFFVEIIKSEQLNQYALSETKFKITLLGTEAFHSFATFKENVVRDSFLALESVYTNRFFS